MPSVVRQDRQSVSCDWEALGLQAIQTQCHGLSMLTWSADSLAVQELYMLLLLQKS
jgi:hypothetical protein